MPASLLSKKQAVVGEIFFPTLPVQAATGRRAPAPPDESVWLSSFTARSGGRHGLQHGSREGVAHRSDDFWTVSYVP